MGFRSIAAAILIALSAPALGCAAPAPAPMEKVGKKYDAITLFRAVYFREGPAAKVVEKWDLPRKDAVRARMKEPPPELVADELRDVAAQFRKDGLAATASKLLLLADDIESGKLPASAAATKNAEAAKRLLIHRIQKSAPKFLARFRKDIQSGNHVRVNRVFREGIARLVAVATSDAPTSVPQQRSFGGEVDDYSGFEGGGYDDGYYDDGYNGGGYDDGYYDDGYNGGGYDDGYNGGGYDDGYNGGGYDDGYDQGAPGGGYDDGYDQGAPGGGTGADTGGTADTTGGADDQAPQGGDEATPIGDQASLHMNVSVYHDTVAASDKVAVAFAVFFIGAAPDDGSLQTASFVDHLTRSFEAE